MAKARLSRWKGIAQSVRGAVHERAGLPNQDAFRLSHKHGEPSIIGAVSDGHGSSESFRSDVGASIAVRVTIEALTPLLKTKEATRLPTLKHLVEQQLARDIVARWRSEIDRHIEANPLPDDVDTGESTEESDKANSNRYLAYGATLLGVLATDAYIIYLQLGDGDIVSVSEDGEATRAIARDERLIANLTTSLCMPDAAMEMHVALQSTSGHVPAMIMLSTDGYSNSFVDEQAFLKVGTDLMSAVRDNGLDGVGEMLGEWLNEASRLGSGDDTTLAILLRTDFDKVAGATPVRRSDAILDRLDRK